MLERLETDLRSTADRLQLSVFADNDVGISFYESNGFELVRTCESDLDDGLAEVVYEKRLGRTDSVRT
ncbi:GNAT family N-acetyltransferase [Natronorubrum sp. DTA7]|uniref:GNAT family N-acetyltransferase n=1 Tax=Natronorubrum sp. DTA7 TaxID=3447016 RepID=UPI003F87D14A